MSNTRHAAAGSPLSQGRYMSSPEYAELRGVGGIAVTAKAALLNSAKQQSLLFFLQGLSLKPGGLKASVRDLLELYQDRIGTAAMHQAGTGSGLVYSDKVLDGIVSDLESWRNESLSQYLNGLVEWGDFEEPTRYRSRSPLDFVCRCRAMALDRLAPFLVELCVNPRLDVLAPGQESVEFDREDLREEFHLEKDEFRRAEVPYFRDILGALYEYQAKYAERVRQGFTMTSIAERTFATLDKCLATRKMVVIEGNSRLGKTTAAQAWCEMHLGEARYVSLGGIVNQTGFFRTLARALGLACTHTQKSTAMQFHVEDMIQRSGLMVVIDEAHYLFGQQERVYTAPHLVNWVNTALCNYKVPVALVTTPQFAHRKAAVERQTGWTAEQLEGRITEYKRLPALPTDADLEGVARKYLPEGGKNAITAIVTYAIFTRRYLPAVVDTIDEARLLAKKAGRDRVLFEDVDAAISQYRIPSDEAQRSAFAAGQARTGKSRRRPLPEPSQPACSGAAGGMPARGMAPAEANDFADQKPADTLVETRRSVRPANLDFAKA